MAGNSKYGFTAEQIEQDYPVTAFVETFASGRHAGITYGAVWAANGTEGAMWGGAYESYPVPLFAFAIQRLLSMFPAPSLLHVHGNNELWEHIRPKLGHVRRAMRPATWGVTTKGQPYAGFEPISEAAGAYDKRRLSFQNLPRLFEGDRFYVPRKAALDLASGEAREALDMHYRETRGGSYGRVAVEG